MYFWYEHDFRHISTNMLSNKFDSYENEISLLSSLYAKSSCMYRMSPLCVLNRLFLIPLSNVVERSTTFPFPHDPMIPEYK